MTNTTSRNFIRTLLITAAAAILLGVAALGYHFLAPSGYLCLDVNPSIELRTNLLDRVTSVTGVNAEGKALLEGYRLTDRDLDDVIEDLVDRMVLQGYLGNSRANDVLLTVDDDAVSNETLKRVNTKIGEYLTYRNLTANVVSQSVDVNDALLEAASKYEVSAGKMSVIDRLAAGDPTLLPSELARTRISDLLSYAKEKQISLELLEERLDDMEDRYGDDNLRQLENAIDNVNYRNDNHYDDHYDDLYDDDHDDRYDDDRYDDDHDDLYDDDRYDDDHDDDHDDDDRYDNDHDDD